MKTIELTDEQLSMMLSAIDSKIMVLNKLVQTCTDYEFQKILEEQTRVVVGKYKTLKDYIQTIHEDYDKVSD